MRIINVHKLQLQFDGDQLDTGSKEHQASLAIDLINGVLQREPNGLGAQLIAYPDEIEVEEEEDSQDDD